MLLTHQKALTPIPNCAYPPPQGVYQCLGSAGISLQVTAPLKGLESEGALSLCLSHVGSSKNICKNQGKLSKSF